MCIRCINWKVSCCITIISICAAITFAILILTTEYECNESFTCPIDSSATTINNCLVNQTQYCCSQINQCGDDCRSARQRNVQTCTETYTIVLFILLSSLSCLCCCSCICNILYEEIQHPTKTKLNQQQNVSSDNSSNNNLSIKKQTKPQQKYQNYQPNSSSNIIAKQSYQYPDKSTNTQTYQPSPITYNNSKRYNQYTNQIQKQQQKSSIPRHSSQTVPQYTPINNKNYQQSSLNNNQSSPQSKNVISKISSSSNIKIHQQNYSSTANNVQVQSKYIASKITPSNIKSNIENKSIDKAQQKYNISKESQKITSNYQPTYDLKIKRFIIQKKKPDIVPYQGITGQWVQAQYFYSERKTFGFYQCQKCQKRWMSAHSRKQFKQACKQCNTYLNASFLWQNTYQQTRKQRALDDNQKPHLSSLCQACRLGKCKDININNNIDIVRRRNRYSSDQEY